MARRSALVAARWMTARSREDSSFWKTWQHALWISIRTPDHFGFVL